MNRKAFTLIELLVVVAIIGILAAVGVVAYNGYTYGARVAVAKNNYHKFIKSELTKCNNGLADKAFNISCPINKTDDLIRALNTECASGDLSKMMNPHLSNTKACRNYLANGNPADLGYLNYYKSNDYVLIILTCWKDPCQPNRVNRDMVEIDLRNF